MSWERGRKEFQRATLSRHGWVGVYKLGRIQYWRDPLTKNVLGDNQAAAVQAAREKATAKPSRRVE